jgi:ABC-2 type transport system ATP-binding protein
MPVESVVVQDLFLRYGKVEALRGATFSAAEGAVLGLLGPNGAGKTSVLRVLVGLRRAGGGRAAVLGRDATVASREVRRLVGYVPQAVSADGSLTGRENATLFAKLYGVRGRRGRRARVEEVLGLVGLQTAADGLVRSYSGGMVRRLEVACALVSSPRVLLLDEPTSGLDPAARRALWQHLDEQRAATGLSILVTTHYLDEAEEHCDQVAVMSRGRVLVQGPPRELRSQLHEDATLEEVYLGLTAGSSQDDGGGLREVRRARRSARRLG